MKLKYSKDGRDGQFGHGHGHGHIWRGLRGVDDVIVGGLNLSIIDNHFSEMNPRRIQEVWGEKRRESLFYLLAGELVFMMGFWSGFNFVSLFIVSAG